MNINRRESELEVNVTLTHPLHPNKSLNPNSSVAMLRLFHWRRPALSAQAYHSPALIQYWNKQTEPHTHTPRETNRSCNMAREHFSGFSCICSCSLFLSFFKAILAGYVDTHWPSRRQPGMVSTWSPGPRQASSLHLSPFPSTSSLKTPPKSRKVVPPMLPTSAKGRQPYYGIAISYNVLRIKHCYSITISRCVDLVT